MVKLSTTSGAAGLPVGVKAEGRTVDFRVDDFTIAIESKGYRVAWSRAAMCPCPGDNDQTGQSSITCPLCGGFGWLMFAPAQPVVTTKVGTLDALQTQIVGSNSGVIFGIMSEALGKQDEYDKVQRRLSGTFNITVRPENKLGYQDRIVSLDETMAYTQWFSASGTATDSVRYPIVCVNLLRTQSTVFMENTDFTVSGGSISWSSSPPTAGTRVAIHYLTYPHWRVISWPHMIRGTNIRAKKASTVTPLGDPTSLPVQAVLQLEFLTDARP